MEYEYPMGVGQHPKWREIEIGIELETDIQEDIADFDNWMTAEILRDDEEEIPYSSTEPFFKYECTDIHNCRSFMRNNYACRCVRQNFKSAKHFAQYNRGIERNVMRGITGE